MSSKEITGGEILARMLLAEGVEKVFGIIDGTYFGFYSALHRLGIEIVTPRHESSAAHMAGAYARLSGRLGVCMASNGPGVANLLPGLVVEEAEGNRVLAITSSRRPGIMYPDRGGSYQCFDQTGVIGRIAKWSSPVSAPERLAELTRMAFRQCFEGRPGVVHLDVPETIMNGKQAPVTYLAPSQYRAMRPAEPRTEDVVAAARLLREAKLPMIHAGSGVIHAGAFDLLRRVATLLHAPVTTSWAARGVISECSVLTIPMPHVELTHKVRNEADAVLIIGSRVGETDWWGRPPYWRDASQQRTVQVDIDAAGIGRNKPVELGIIADAKRFLALLVAELEKAPVPESLLALRRPVVAGYTKRVGTDRAAWDKALGDERIPMHPAHIASTCRAVFPTDAVLVADGGNAAMWTMFHHSAFMPNRLLSTFKFGMLGANMGQAIGAAKALPGVPVCCIIGDGAMGFHASEIETAVRVGAQVIFIVMCDRQWGMVKMNQQFMLRPVKTMILKRILTDNGSGYRSLVFKERALELGISQRFTKPYRP